MKRAFILDFDGTIVDSMTAWSRVGHKFLERHGCKDIPTDLWDIIRPMSRLESADYFISQWGIELTPEEIRDELNGIMEEAYENEVALKPGALEFLQKHSDRKMCIATNTDRYLVEKALTKLGIGEFFEFTITTGEVCRGKHDPLIFLTAADKLGVPIGETIVFEDALHGISSAKGAGFYTVAVYDADNAGDQELIKATADEYIHSLGEWEES